MNDAAVTDLHGLVWWGLGKRYRLGAVGGALFRRADAGRAVIQVPTVVLDHLAVAVERGLVHLDLPLPEFMERLFATGSYFPAALTPEIIARAAIFPDSVPRYDRLLAATATILRRPLVSERREIASWSGVKLVW